MAHALARSLEDLARVGQAGASHERERDPAAVAGDGADAPAVGAVLVGAVADRPVLQVDGELDVGQRLPDEAVDVAGRGRAAPGRGPTRSGG